MNSLIEQRARSLTLDLIKVVNDHIDNKGMATEEAVCSLVIVAFRVIENSISPAETKAAGGDVVMENLRPEGFDDGD
jgi:hypothetical protein